MVIHLARYRLDDEIRWATVADGGLSPLAGSYASTADLIRDGADDWRSAVERPARLPTESVELLSPVTTPCRVLCQGANYRQHAIESGMDPDARPFNLFFDKTDAAVTGPDTPVTRPPHVRLLDHDAVRGRPARRGSGAAGRPHRLAHHRHGRAGDAGAEPVPARPLAAVLEAGSNRQPSGSSPCRLEVEDGNNDEPPTRPDHNLRGPRRTPRGREPGSVVVDRNHRPCQSGSPQHVGPEGGRTPGVVGLDGVADDRLGG